MRFTYQPGTQPLSGYTIQRGIHHGGFGEVYLARSEGGKDVALKLIRHVDEDVEIRGVTQCLNLKHPNLVNLFDVKSDAHGDRWVVMEYVGGSSLEDVITSFPNGLPLNEVRDWLRGLVAGVAFLHDQGIIHRDLKPANVYRENGIVKVGDVGLSKQLEGERRKQTQSVGTVYYMAPEVARDQYGPQVDVYSLGVILFELIAGKLPFNGETTGEILMKHLVTPPDLSPIPKSLRPTLSRALEKDPAKRTASVRQLEADFVRSLDDRTEPLWIPESAFLRQSAHSVDRRSGQKRNEIPPSQRRTLPSPIPRAEKNRPSTRQRRRFVLFLILVSGAFLFFAPQAYLGMGSHSARSWLGLSLITAAFATLAIRRPTRDSNPLFSNQQRAQCPPSRWTSWYSAPRKADAVQPMTLTNRVRSLGTSLSTAALISSLLASGLFLSLEAFHRSAIMPSMAHGAFFTAISVLGCGFLLMTHAVSDYSGWTRFESRVARMAAGILLGTIAYQLDDYLYINVPQAAYVARSAYSSIGIRPLTTSDLDPTWIGYCWFFAALFGIRHWSREIDSRRKATLSFVSLFGAILVAYVLSLVFRFPQSYAILWSVTFSVALQLTSRLEANREQGGIPCRQA